MPRHQFDEPVSTDRATDTPQDTLDRVARQDADSLRAGTSAETVTDRGLKEEAQVGDLGFLSEPPDGIEPSTYALRVRRSSRLS